MDLRGINKKCNSIEELEEILNSITDFAVENGLIENDRMHFNLELKPYEAKVYAIYK